MFFMNIKSLLLCCLVLIASQSSVAQLNLPLNVEDFGDDVLNIDDIGDIGDVVGVAGTTIADVLTNITSIVQDDLTRKLCSMNTYELCIYYGFHAEVHTIVTEDGYILTVFRCRLKHRLNETSQVVVIQHGIISSSDDSSVGFYALAYCMARAGYDVWLANNRGSYYSRKHKWLNPDRDPKYWNFSWHEIGILDYPAMYNYILNLTGNEKLNVIGHSQGCTATFVLCSLYPDYCAKVIRKASFLAPVAYMKHSAQIWQFFSKFRRVHQGLFEYTEFLPRGVFGKLAASFCTLTNGAICKTVINTFFGQSKDEIDKKLLPARLCLIPSGSASKQVIHYGLVTEYPYFGRYFKDFGLTPEKVPNSYNLSRIRLHMSLHVSFTDTFTSKEDFYQLANQIPTVDFIQIIPKKFNHIDFLWGKTAPKRIYRKIVKYLGQELDQP